MASSSRLSGASVPGGLDVAWKYARPIEGNKHGTICTFCESTFQSGGITRLKYHLAEFDPHKSVKKCREVPPDIKKEVIAWINDKESSKQHKKSVEENIRSTARGGYIGAIGKQYSGKISQPINPSEDDMAISFGSMSIGTRPSTNSNESYDGYGYVMSDYSGTSYGAQDDETDYGPTSWVNPNYPMYGRTIRSSRETHVHHVQTWLTNCSGYMTWYDDYCMNLDGCSSLFEPHRSSSFM